MPTYLSRLPDGRTVQRLDTLDGPRSAWLGVEVYHPHLQVGEDRCAWTQDDLVRLERELLGGRATSEGDAPGPTYDRGFLVEVMPDPDFAEQLRGRYVDPACPGDRGLHHDVTTLWTPIPRQPTRG